MLGVDLSGHAGGGREGSRGVTQSWQPLAQPQCPAPVPAAPGTAPEGTGALSREPGGEKSGRDPSLGH